MSDPGDETDFIDNLAHNIAFMGMSVKKIGGYTPMSNEKLEDEIGFDAELAFGIREMTPQESADMDRRMREHEELKAAGLLDDRGQQILPTNCPACFTVADGTAAGWNSSLGDEVRCERPRGHTGGHMYTILWEDDERSYGWNK